MLTSNRRYDIDWIRVIAIGLLLIYHVAIGFQPWGLMIGFITNDKPWTGLWVPMTMLNIWRIPLLFFVSGMGVYFAMQQRSWVALIKERTLRILVPLLFGMVAIVPLSGFLLKNHYHWPLSYGPDPGHLWFLGNIFVYVLMLSPFFYYLKCNENGRIATRIKKLFSSPLVFLLLMAAFVAEVVIINPRPYELYYMTWHGFILGLLAFFFGFCFVLTGDSFQKMISKWKWAFLVVAIGLFIFRTLRFPAFPENYLLAIESTCWILTVLAFGFRYLNRPGKTLTYLSEAAYPVYILHMIFLYIGSTLIFPLDIVVPMKFVLVLVFTFVGCFAGYELIRRITLLRPLFGLKVKRKKCLTLSPVSIKLI